MKKIILVTFFIIFVLHLNSINPEKNILILNSCSSDSKWDNDLTLAIKQKIATWPEKVNLYNEQLDVLRTNFNSDSFINYLHTKYIDTYFDLIIACDDPAYSFIKEHYNLHFPGRPVIFCGINNFKPGFSDINVNYTGVNEKIDIEETLNLLLKLIPKLQNVYIYGDKSGQYALNRLIIMECIPKYETRLKFHFIDDMNIEQLKIHSSNLNKNSIIFVISSIKDKNNKIIYPIENSAGLLYPYANVPIISFWDFWMGNGVLGGKLVMAKEQGDKAADLAIEILKGKSVKDLPVIMKSPNTFIFDYEVLKKFKLNLKKLPSNSIIINKPKNFYEINKRWFWSLSVLTATMLILSVLLSLQIRKRMLFEIAYKENLLFLNTFIDTIPNPVFYKSLNGDFVLCNSALETLLDKSKDEIINKKSADIFNESMSILHNSKDKMILNGEKKIISYYVEFQTSQGFIKHLVISKAAIKNLEGKINGIIGIIQDISEIKKAENLISRQLKELEDKNREMESFIYTVSHDLKSPLITIKGFLNFINLDYENNNHEQFNKDFEKISLAADKMQFLLEDLLQLSRIGRVVNASEEFNMSEVIVSVISYLEGIIKSSGAKINFQKDMPIVYADKNRLREIWQNLIENSIKYKKPNVAPIIEIGWEKQQNLDVFFLNDNGIGIDIKFQDKVFELFEKLNPNTSGTGIGLARVKKIVELYNGKIWIDKSSPENGCSIKFYLNGNKYL